MLVIINNNMGNIMSVANAFKMLQVEYKISNKAKDIVEATSLIFPGVGAFPKAMENLYKHSLVDLLKEKILINGTPFLGICLGMQLLFEESEEQKRTEGLKIFNGKVKKIESSSKLKVPHVGWNTIQLTKDTPLLEGIDKSAKFYYDHSYYACQSTNEHFCKLKYGANMTVGINRKNIFGVQFHPEKSQRNGLKLLRNFVNISMKEN